MQKSNERENNYRLYADILNELETKYINYFINSQEKGL